MSKETPSWKKTDPQHVVWMMGPIDGVAAGTFSHGPSPEKEDFLHHAREGDILLARDARDQSLVAMHIAYDNQFLRLNQGMTGKLFDTISANLGDGFEKRNDAMRLAVAVSSMPLTSELSEQSFEAIRAGYEVLEDGIRIARRIALPDRGAAEESPKP